MQSAFSIAFEQVFEAAYGETSTYAILDENLEAITDLFDNVIEEEF
jgi:hypothetical protein